MNPRAANEVFQKDCLVRLGTCVAPVGRGKAGQEVLDVEMRMPDGSMFREKLKYGDLKLLKVPYGPKLPVTLRPRRGLDVGAGPGQELKTEIVGGQVGIIFDTRGRQPFEIPTDPSQRVRVLSAWARAMDEYPEL